ncbi:hypothetical protein FD951_06555 [Pseudomonas chlororaphis subsp. aurantiaca]|nr:hypothetical protein FD951_06555 [Pseudomonas chlororaphis subsp. aurantiaca]
MIKARISAWRDVSFSISIALSFYTVTGIIYSEWRLAILLFPIAAGRSGRRCACLMSRGWLQDAVGMVK